MSSTDLPFQFCYTMLELYTSQSLVWYESITHNLRKQNNYVLDIVH